MSIRISRLLLLVGLLASLYSVRYDQSPPTPAAPDVFAAPLNAGCVHVTPSTCKIHVDPFTIPIASGQRLVAFQIKANTEVIYDFRTDVSNPPSGSYTPSAVKKDFAARCGQTYTINVLGRDTGDSGFLNMGQAQPVTCPIGTYSQFLPAVQR